MNEAESLTNQKANHYSSLAPRFWHGMRAGVWWRMLARNRFRISPKRCHIALGVSIVSPINDLLAFVQYLLHGRRIDLTELSNDPVFILGHWRSGTTLLHELLVSNPDFAFPSTYQCLAPSHFLVSPWIAKYGGFLLPEKRPMDNMAAGWQLPQEDEFALMNLGLPTPYLRIAFPQTQPRHLEYLDFDGIPEGQLDRWKKGFLGFIKALTYSYGGRRLVLKSPPHTGRIRELMQLFPRARFIHLVRDPRKLFPSTMRLWKSLDQVQGLQEGLGDQELKQYVRQCMERMYGGFHAHRDEIPNHQILDIRYEDLVASPKDTVRMIYERLELGEFESVAHHLDPLLTGHRDYRVNRHRSDPEWESEVMRYCSDYARRYGYLLDPNAAAIEVEAV